MTPPLLTPLIDTLSAIQVRRSVGKTLPDAPPRALIETLLDAAVCAPNHHRTEPWRFYVVSGESRAAIGSRVAAAMAARDEDARAVEKQCTAFLRAPYVIAVTTRPGSDAAETLENRDAVAAAIQNMLLAGTALGLATIWRTGKLVSEPAVRAFLGLDAAETVVGFVYVGYPAAAPVAWDRQPATASTRWHD